MSRFRTDRGMEGDTSLETSWALAVICQQVMTTTIPFSVGWHGHPSPHIAAQLIRPEVRCFAIHGLYEVDQAISS